MPADLKKIDLKNLDLKSLDLKKIPKPVLGVVAVLVLAGAGWGVFQAVHGSNPAPPPPPPSRGGPTPGSMPPGSSFIPPGSSRPGPAQTHGPASPATPGSAPPADSAADSAAHQVEALRAHLLQHPDIARVDYQTSNVGTFDVILRPGVSDAEAIEVAKRIRQYMVATYPTIGDMVIAEITLHRVAGDQSQLHVEQSVDAKAETQTWHVVVTSVNGPQIIE